MIIVCTSRFEVTGSPSSSHCFFLCSRIIALFQSLFVEINSHTSLRLSICGTYSQELNRSNHHDSLYRFKMTTALICTVQIHDSNFQQVHTTLQAVFFGGNRLGSILSLLSGSLYPSKGAIQPPTTTTTW